MWKAELDRARARVESFDVAAELEAARARAVRWRTVTSLSTFHLPVPLIARDILRWEGEWLDRGEDDRFEDLVGLDEARRPVAHLLDPGSEWERPMFLWRHDDTELEEVELRTSETTVRLVALDDGRPVRVVAASSYGGEVAVRLIRWEGQRPVRVDGARAYGDAPATPEARAAIHDAAGELERVVRTIADRMPGEGIAEALARAATLVPADLIWDGRARRPQPWPGDAGAMIEPLATALDAALREAAAASGVEEPYLLEVRNGPGELDGRPPFPPFAWLAGRAFRDRMRRASGHDETARHYLWKGVEAGDVAELDLVDLLDAGALRSCRALSTGLRTGSPRGSRQRAAAIAGAVGDRLAELLNVSAWPGAAEPFLALVEAGDPYRDDPGLDRARRAVGEARVDSFLKSIASASPARDEQRADALADAALTDRAALEDLLRSHGLDAHAGRLAHEVAEDALLLEPPPDGAPAPRSRLGGPPLLPPDEPWPVGDHGRPLTFLAAIHLAELPPSLVAERLPPSGWLLFFAAIDPDEDGNEMVGESDAGARVLHVPGGVEPVPAEPRGDPPRDRPVAMRRVLTLPDGYESAQELGLDVYAAETYEEACESLYGALDPVWRERARRMSRPREPESDDVDADWTDEDDLVWPDEEDRLPADDGRSLDAHHWIGGLVTGVQGHSPEEGTVLLLHIAFDEQLGFPFLDGGAIQFRIAPDALAAHDFSRASADADSC